MPSDSAGTVQTVLVCSTEQTEGFSQLSPADAAGNPISICPSGTRLYSGQAYLLNVTQQQNIDAALGPFDYGYAAGLWSLAFTTIVGLWLVSHGIGVVLGFIRRG